MSSDSRDVHLDEGQIHAWLDGALDAEDAARVEAHAASCAECAALVAEARGLVAGASRVVSMLDDAPVPLVRIAPPDTPTASPTAWRLLRVTPARAAIAAMLIVAAGVTLTRQRVATDAGVSPATARGDAPPSAVADTRPDSLLTSAIVAKLKRDQPARVLSRTESPGVSTPVVTGATTAPASNEPSDAMRVAAARSSLEAQRDSLVPADRARAGFAASAKVSSAQMQQVITAAKAADGVASAPLAGRVAGLAGPLLTAGGCYRIESSASDAKWGVVPLPLTIAFDASGRGGRVLDSSGAPTDEQTVATFATPDSIQLRLRRIGYSGTMQLTPLGDAFGGRMQSSAETLGLSEVVVTNGALDSEKRDGRDGRSAKSSGATDPRPAPAAAAKSLAPRSPAASPLAKEAAVTARRVTCPVR